MLEISKKIKLPDYDDKQGKDKDIEQFKKDISKELNIPEEQIEVYLKNGHLVARYQDDYKPDTQETKIKEINLKFVDKNDEQRFLKYTAESKSFKLSEFGIKGKEITISNYDDRMLKSDIIKLFKDDLSRLLETGLENIELRIIDNELFASIVDKKEKILIKFEDGYDKKIILDIVKNSKSVRAIHLGEKKDETTFTTSVSSSSPFKIVTNNQTIDFKTFLDEQGIHQVKMAITFSETLSENGDFKDIKNNIKDITLGYSNADYGNLNIHYDPSSNKFKVDVNSYFVDSKLEQFKKNLIEGKTSYLLAAGGIIILVAGGVAIAANVMDSKEFSAPINGTILDSGKFKIKGGTGTKIRIGDKDLDINFKTFQLEAIQNWDSQFKTQQKAQYNLEEKKLETEVGLEYKGLNFKLNNNYNFTDNIQNTHVEGSYTHTLYKNIKGSISYAQDFDNNWNIKSPKVGVGLTYQYKDNLMLNVGGSVGATDFNSQPTYGVSIGIKINF